MHGAFRLLLAASLVALAAPDRAFGATILFSTSQVVAQPDGTQISRDTVSTVPAQGGPVTDLVASDGSGTGLFLGSTSNPRWSPDRSQVLFRASDPALATQYDSLFVIPATGGVPRNITAAVPVTSLLTGGSWSPRGTRVAFVGEIDPGTGAPWNDEVFTVAADGSGGRQLTRDADGLSKFFPVYSPDGASIAYVWEGPNGYRLAVVPAGGGRARVLDTNVLKGATVSWSPDSRRIAYARFSADGTSSDVFTVDVRDGRRRNITKGAFPGAGGVTWAGSVNYPAYSPSGDRIAFVYVPGVRTGSDRGELWTISPSGGGATRLATHLDAYAYGTGLGWSADGATLAFTDGSTPASNPDFFPFDAAVASVSAAGGLVFLLAGPYSGRVESTSLR